MRDRAVNIRDRAVNMRDLTVNMRDLTANMRDRTVNMRDPTVNSHALAFAVSVHVVGPNSTYMYITICVVYYKTQTAQHKVCASFIEETAPF